MRIAASLSGEAGFGAAGLRDADAGKTDRGGIG